jgi:hypothetical protein
VPELVPISSWHIGVNIVFEGGQVKKRRGRVRTLQAYSFTLGAHSPANTGTGSVANITAGEATVEEIITITCTATASNSGTFSVVGSVSGDIGTATVGTRFASPQIQFTIEDGNPDFIVGDAFIYTVVLEAPADDIHHLLGWSTSTQDYWLWASLTNIYRWDGAEHTDVTRVAGSPLVSIPYSATDAIQWTSCILGDVAILNNGVDIPQYMGTASTTMANFPTGGSAWPSTLRCKSLRPFKQYLVALNLTNGADDYPQSVRWSTAADPGALPNWDITDPTLEAGEVSLSESDGEVIDGMPLGDSFMIYKDDSVVAMQLVGGQYVMRFSTVFNDVGILSQNCVTMFPEGHFVADHNDIYVHNGNTKRSILQDKAREAVYGRIDPSKVGKSFCVTDVARKECLFCWADETATYPNLALVWNYQNDTLSSRTISEATCAAYGRVRSTTAADETWDADNGTWDTDFGAWDSSTAAVDNFKLLYPDTVGHKVLVEATEDDGEAFFSFVTHPGLNFDAPDKIKHLYEIYPNFRGTGTVYITTFGDRGVLGAVNDVSTAQFVIGTDRKINCHAWGYNLGMSIYSAGDDQWELSSMVLKGQVSGDV